MLSKLATTSGQIVGRLCRHNIPVKTCNVLIPNHPPKASLTPSRDFHKENLFDGKPLVSRLQHFQDTSPKLLEAGRRFVSCKKVKERKSKKQACSKKKTTCPAPCPETPCRCATPTELNTPTRVRMDKSKRDKPPSTKKDRRNKKCKSSDCDFMNQDD